MREGELKRYRVGEIVKAKVIEVTKDYVFVDLQTKSEGIISKEELFEQEIKPGDIIEATIIRVSPEGEIFLSQKLAYTTRQKEFLYQAYQNRLPVEGKIVGLNKGGFEVKVGGMRGFCPLSQIEQGYCENPESYIGKQLHFYIINYEENNIVLSRRALLEEEAKRKAKETLKKIYPGAVLEGEVTSIKPYGVFVDLGGLQGLVHISEIDHVRIDDPSELVSVGDKVKVEVLSVEGGDSPKDIKVSLSMKALKPHPWDLAKEKFKIGDIVDGVVKNITNFGAFVEIERGVEGLVHLMEICDEHINHPREKLSIGDRVKVKILDVDWNERKLSLSIREALADLGERPELRIGNVVKVSVIKPRITGLHVQIIGAGRKGRGFIPLEECDVVKGEELRSKYPVGKEFEAKIIAVDKDKGSIKLSIKQLIEEREEKEVEELKEKYRFEGSLSTLGDFLKDIKLKN